MGGLILCGKLGCLNFSRSLLKYFAIKHFLIFIIVIARIKQVRILMKAQCKVICDTLAQILFKHSVVWYKFEVLTCIFYKIICNMHGNNFLNSKGWEFIRRLIMASYRSEILHGK